MCTGTKKREREKLDSITCGRKLDFVDGLRDKFVYRQALHV